MDKYKIPKVERVGKTIFLTRKFEFESLVKLNIDVKVRSDLCPEQVAHSGTTCQVQLIAFNGGKAINTIEKLVQITAAPEIFIFWTKDLCEGSLLGSLCL